MTRRNAGKAGFELLDQATFANKKIRKFRLKTNGLDVVLLCDRAAPIVAYQTWYRVGSRHEREGITGIAHLFEHLMFNQTEHLAAGEFDRLIESTGGDTNAATWVDWTYYRDNLPAAELPLAVRLESDRMAHLTLTERQVETEREVVANERRLRVDDDVGGTLDEEAFKLAFRKHPYHWPTIGWMKDIMAITTDDCRAFYRAYYAPNNATVVVVGDFEESEALALIAKYYGEIPASDTLPKETVVKEPAQAGVRRKRIAKAVPAERVLIAYKAPPQPHPDAVPMQLLDDVLVGGPSSRLYRRLVIDDEIATDVSGHLTPFRDMGLLQFNVSMKRGHSAKRAEAIIAEEIRAMASKGPSKDEVEKARARLETQLWSGLTTADGKAEAIGHYEVTARSFRRLFETAAAIASAKPRDLARVARKWLRPQQRTIVTAVPMRARARS